MLHVGQSNELVIPPIAIAEQVNLEWRRLADIDAMSVLADLVLAVCQILDLHLTCESRPYFKGDVALMPKQFYECTI